jgi:hypothetical protein
MSKAQYLLIAGFIGFYGLLFTYLLLRALVAVIHARFERARPVAEIKRPYTGARAGRAWTAALWRNA